MNADSSVPLFEYTTKKGSDDTEDEKQQDMVCGTRWISLGWDTPDSPYDIREASPYCLLTRNRGYDTRKGDSERG